MNKNARIYAAGHTGLVGSAIVRKLRECGYRNLLLRTRAELDLTRQDHVETFFASEKPEFVFLAAAKVGGILANSTSPADFIYENMAISMNIIEAARKYGARKLLNLGSSCIYPKHAPQPIKEEYLLSGLLEPTNEAYALSKIAAIKHCKYCNEQFGTDFISLMPTNLYGPGDKFDLKDSHVLPALIRKFSDAKKAGADKVEVWGTGAPRREFLFVDDLAEAAVFLMENFSYSDIGEFINVGTGEDLTIKELAMLVKEIVGFEGEIAFNPERPDGTPRKLLDVSRLAGLGWRHRTTLEEGIRKTWSWYQESVNCLT